ncbi:MAG: FKBP-type peptidyl-prolyl cis-trans isomerase [Paludibacteraceae bacterium]|nr:FKBP-type peptidyl-prolyl cis-trans isomerase [Paludibacteraceae bacterium]
MAISKENIFVQLKYTLYVGNDGEEVMLEETPDDQLFRFTTGLGMVLPKFEEALYGKVQGDSFDFYIGTEDAYGDYVEDLCVDLDKSIFKNEKGEIDENILFVGNILPMMSAEGQRMNGKVVEITDSNVKMDFNHPLAGERLHFKGEVKEERPATEFEIELVKGHHGCGGCGGGGCSGGCEGGCGGNCGEGGCGGGCHGEGEGNCNCGK